MAFNGVQDLELLPDLGAELAHTIDVIFSSLKLPGSRRLSFPQVR